MVPRKPRDRREQYTVGTGSCEEEKKKKSKYKRRKKSKVYTIRAQAMGLRACPMEQ